MLKTSAPLESDTFPTSDPYSVLSRDTGGSERRAHHGDENQACEQSPTHQLTSPVGRLMLRRSEK